MPIEILGGGGTGAPFSGSAEDVSVAATPSNYSAATPDVEAHLAGIDAAVGGKVAKATFDANSILAANADDTPAAVVIGENDIVGRLPSGNIAGITAGDLTEEETPATGDFLLGWESGGAIRKFDVGDLPGGSTPWDGDISDINLDGGTDIGADLADADLVLVDDGASGTNRKSALSRFWTYISGKLFETSANDADNRLIRQTGSGLLSKIQSSLVSINDSGFLSGVLGMSFSSAAAVTISGGAISGDRCRLDVSGEGATDDDLVSVSSVTGLVLLRNAGGSSYDITIKHGTSANQISTPDGNDLVVPDNGLVAIYRPNTSSAWQVVGVPGPTGATGATGETGPAGAAGADGVDGDGTVTFLAGEFRYPASNPAPLDEDTGTYNTILRHVFDDTTEEFVMGDFRLPANLNTDGTVTFRAVGYATTAAASKYVQLKVYHRARAANEVWDVDYASKISGNKAISGTQDRLDVLEWTETVSNLGWAAGDFVTIKLSRINTADNGGGDDHAADDLSGDYGVVAFQVDIPRS